MWRLGGGGTAAARFSAPPSAAEAPLRTAELSRSRRPAPRITAVAGTSSGGASPRAPPGGGDAAREARRVLGAARLGSRPEAGKERRQHLSGEGPRCVCVCAIPNHFGSSGHATVLSFPQRSWLRRLSSSGWGTTSPTSKTPPRADHDRRRARRRCVEAIVATAMALGGLGAGDEHGSSPRARFLLAGGGREPPPGRVAAARPAGQDEHAFSKDACAPRCSTRSRH